MLPSSRHITSAAICIAAQLYCHCSHAQQYEFEVFGGATGVALTTDDSRIQGSGTFSFDLHIERPTARGRWIAYIEANSILDRQGTSNIIIESNADAGSALDPDRRGRLQLSELKYRWSTQRGNISVGLLDPSVYLDASPIANNENSQFLGASFVNNPTIEFPDYTLGVAWTKPRVRRLPGLNAVLSSSNGIADNPNLSYSQLVQVTRGDKGVFAAVEADFSAGSYIAKLGTWLNTRNHVALSSGRTNVSNSGSYALLGRIWNFHAVSLRLGTADADVQRGQKSVAVTYRRDFNSFAVGAGYAKVFLSQFATAGNVADSRQMEVYARFSMTRHVQLTGLVQRIKHSNFVLDRNDVRNSVWLAALRLHANFSF